MKQTIKSTMIFVVILCGMLVNSSNVYSEVGDGETPNIDSIRMDVEYLASDDLEGRFPGTPGADEAAEYIAILFMSMGLQPVGNDFFQEFDITTSVSLGTDNSLVISTPEGSFDLTVGNDFTPLMLSSDGNAAGDVVFAGYGITAPEYGWDDYEEIDAEGKIVFCMMGEPGQDDPDSIFNGNYPTLYSGIRWKAENAADHGAVTLMLVTGPNYLGEDEEDELIGLDGIGGFGESEIPVLQVSQETADILFSTMAASLAMFQGEMERHGMAAGMPLEGLSASLSVDLERDRVTARNVAAELPGNDPDLMDEYVIIAAHYDHLGWGEINSNYEGSEPQIHNGADDNASGTAGVLELVRMFTTSSVEPSRSILFICFSGEELGTLGAHAYINDPIVPLENTSAIINMDMVGRLNDGDIGIPSCIVQGTGSAEEWEDIVNRASSETLELVSSSSAIGGDFIPFLASGIPAISFFTGVHDEYHRPSDDADLINYAGMVKVFDAVYDVAWAVAEMPGKLTFVENENQATEISNDGGDGPMFGVYFGTIPDFSNIEDGYWITGVQMGSPAESAGLMAGDQILKVGEFEIGDIYDYTYALGEFEPGDTVEVIILRDGEEIVVSVTLTAR